MKELAEAAAETAYQDLEQFKNRTVIVRSLYHLTGMLMLEGASRAVRRCTYISL